MSLKIFCELCSVVLILMLTVLKSHNQASGKTKRVAGCTGDTGEISLVPTHTTDVLSGHHGKPADLLLPVGIHMRVLLLSHIW